MGGFWETQGYMNSEELRKKIEQAGVVGAPRSITWRKCIRFTRALLMESIVEDVLRRAPGFQRAGSAALPVFTGSSSRMRLAR